MSDTKNTGGPAFPMHGKIGETTVVHQQGMNLRDYFAAKAMQELMEHYPTCGRGAMDCADTAYWYADAMLKAREQ